MPVSFESLKVISDCGLGNYFHLWLYSPIISSLTLLHPVFFILNFSALFSTYSIFIHPLKYISLNFSWVYLKVVPNQYEASEGFIRFKDRDERRR